ncbi:phospholipid scramblase 1-like [Ischnura elegans]|uniref:phospholipid scramblase 1-like n=1 Tax=Ischnura elegans TaxID=197161 RepID=UPI001ED87718|nr:phospholipid scramblase 1-like [Ischnura elegans]
MERQDDETVVANQPQSGIPWRDIADLLLDCPPGLEYLTTIDRITILQRKSMRKIFTGFQTLNIFTLFDASEEVIYRAEEESHVLMRCGLGFNRPYYTEIRDTDGNEVIHIYRRFAFSCYCCHCYRQEIEVSLPKGTLIGTVEQEWSLGIPKFIIRDISGDVILRIRGPYITFCWHRSDVDFKVLLEDGKTKIGQISKENRGFTTEKVANADRFGIYFPINLDVRMKAILIAAAFLINSMYFEV